MERLADRFFLDNGRWIDAATGARVRIHVEQASELDALDWDEQCGRLFNTRHPLLNPLIDYGAAPDGRRFEAYAYGLPVYAAGAIAERGLLNLVGVLRTAGISLTADRSRYAVREIHFGAGDACRAVGIRLQPRRALDAVRETLEAPATAPAIITLAGPAMAGLRTARLMVARTARTLGFAPVCAAVLVQHGHGAFSERHLCVLADDDSPSRHLFAGALVQLAAASARRHVVVRFTRSAETRDAVVLDPLPLRALMGMVIAPEGEGLLESQLFDAARIANGRPGVFLSRLRPGGAPSGRGALVVHETPQEYAVDSAQVASVPETPTRTLATALRALPRAHALAGRGRHAAARRALERAARVLKGRRRPEAAAECLVFAGRLALDRGDIAAAIAWFEEARQLSPHGGAAISAAIGLGEAWSADQRHVEAEAVLRGALSAAETVGGLRHRRVALAALVRCLDAQGRPADAVAVAATSDWNDDDPESAVLLSALAQCHAALGRVETAIRLARRGEAKADAIDNPRAAVFAEFALAAVLAATADSTGRREHLDKARSIARRAHLPLAAIHAEVALYEEGTLDGDPKCLERARRRLETLRRVELPRVLGDLVDRAIRRHEERAKTSIAPVPQSSTDIHREAAAALEMLLQVGQQAADDRASIAAVCGAVLRRVGAASVMVLADDRRVLACEGRPWVAHSSVAAQALVTGMPCASDAAREPREAADAVRYGGEVIGTIACRWTPATPVDALGSAAVVHAAALALAAPMRAVLDRVVPPPPATAWGDLLGDSPASITLRDAVVRAARVPFPVLIEGESGSGKELVARAIHRLGQRRDRRFCPLNCAALNDELIEAELFGHARGAFTGAATERAGLFEEADGGTLFLDEVGELSPRAQAKLLRVLQEGEVRRVGENLPRRVDTRIVAATNRRLEEEVAAGRFRADLRFRLDVVRLTVPALRDRPGDIPVLAAHFWSGASRSVGSQATLSRDTLASLSRYDWPGNVRELQNVIACIAVHSPRRGRIGPASLPAHVARSSVPLACTFEAARADFDRRFIRAALASVNGQRAKAAERLGITRQGLAKMIRRLGIEPSTGEPEN